MKAELCTTVVCHECSNHVHLPALKPRQKALCPRCGFVLTKHTKDSFQKLMAFAISAFIFLALSMPFKFLGFSASGQEQSIGIISGLNVLVEQDYLFLAIIQMLSIVILPAIVLVGLIAVVIPIQLNKEVPYAKRTLDLVYALIPWSMAEIFLIGVLVSLIKISSMADITMGLSFYAYIGFTLCMSATVLYTDKHQLYLSATKEHHSSHPLNRSQSIQRTWALLITSIILYIPANLLPIMNTRFLGANEPSTILGGVLLLWESGSYPIALIIFIASVIVPIGKLVILIWLNYTVQNGMDKKHSERIFWYRVTEFIGRWSMVDVFVVAILVSLIQLGNTMTILPGPASIAFCGVVILTMLAAMTFDTRLIWTDTAVKHE
ncbi:paraquat-inducible protein A [Aliiglaciecola sp. M165]|nr:paraquat-inducible protein A [Aliiglaciecola sp. M165]